MKVLFVRPNIYAGRASDAMEPLSFAILKSLTPPDVEVVFYDERLEDLPFDEACDLVAITVETFTAHRAYQIASEYRKRGVRVVMGGYHPTFLPQEAMRFADAVVQGDAEGIWERVLVDARRGKLQRLYNQPQFPSLQNSKPDRSIFAGKRYAPISLVQYARGCRYNCDFCSIRAFYGSDLRQRPVEHVVKEIAGLPRKQVFFVDDNIFVDVPKAKELFRALIPLGITWWCQVSIDIAHDEELLKLMRASGCMGATIGFESLNMQNLSQMKKRWSQRYGDYVTSIRKLQDNGLMIYGSFVFGYDHDTPDSFEPAVEFAVENKFFLGNFIPLTPTPAAPLFDRLQKENRLIHEAWWLEPNYRYGQAAFHPRGMTADELTQGCYRSKTMFNTHSSIFKRAFAPHTNMRSLRRLGFYFLGNYISRREIHAKQGMFLGGQSVGVTVPEQFA